MDKLISKAMEMTTEQIIEAVTLIGGSSTVSSDKKNERYAMLVAYERKTSAAKVRELMYQIDFDIFA